jgi:hypothetical protein
MKLCEMLKEKSYSSNGAAFHYKTKENFINLCSHKTDFGTEAEWHFSH